MAALKTHFRCNMSSSNESIDTDNEEEILASEITKKRRRGVRNEDNYQRNVIKKARTSGVGYKNYKGRTVDAKQIGIPCK